MSKCSPTVYRAPSLICLPTKEKTTQKTCWYVDAHLYCSTIRGRITLVRRKCLNSPRFTVLYYSDCLSFTELLLRHGLNVNDCTNIGTTCLEALLNSFCFTMQSMKANVVECERVNLLSNLPPRFTSSPFRR